MSAKLKDDALFVANAVTRDAGLPSYSDLVKELGMLISKASLFPIDADLKKLNQQIEHAQALIDRVVS